MIKAKLKKYHEFHSFEEFYDYVEQYMNNIRFEVVDCSLNDIEIRLKNKHATIGVWSDLKKYGYIKEYRNDARLAVQGNKITT